MFKRTSEDGVKLIKSFEGFSSTPYSCAAGYKTIGYGHRIKPQEKYNYLNEQDAENLLKKDLILVEAAVIRNIYVPLSHNQFDSLVSFTFNLGPAALQRSTLRQKINYQCDGIRSEFMRWVYVRGRRIKGLEVRRDLEASLFYA